MLYNICLKQKCRIFWCCFKPVQKQMVRLIGLHSQTYQMHSWGHFTLWLDFKYDLTPGLVKIFTFFQLFCFLKTFLKLFPYISFSGLRLASKDLITHLLRQRFPDRKQTSGASGSAAPGSLPGSGSSLSPGPGSLLSPGPFSVKP